jgi:hypothetical protein
MLAAVRPERGPRSAAPGPGAPAGPGRVGPAGPAGARRCAGDRPACRCRRCRTWPRTHPSVDVPPRTPWGTGTTGCPAAIRRSTTRPLVRSMMTGSSAGSLGSARRSSAAARSCSVCRNAQRSTTAPASSSTVTSWVVLAQSQPTNSWPPSGVAVWLRRLVEALSPVLHCSALDGAAPRRRPEGPRSARAPGHNADTRPTKQRIASRLDFPSRMRRAR